MSSQTNAGFSFPESEKRTAEPGGSALPISSRERIQQAALTLFAQYGYEATSTVSICRAAGTSESQLQKHFSGKQGLLEAIFDSAWGKINDTLDRHLKNISEPNEKLRKLVEIALDLLQRDRQLLTLFLLEGRRIRDGNSVVLVPGFLEFVKTVDGILQQLADTGKLKPEIHPQALRSALIGAIEGMLRDQLLQTSAGLPGGFSNNELRSICFEFLLRNLEK